VDQNKLPQIFPTIDIVIPVYRGSETLEELVTRVNYLKTSPVSFPSCILRNVILVCDEPVDNSSEIASILASKFDFLKVISLSCNSGQHMATAAGFIHTTADWILTIDEDLQHPPELIVQTLLPALHQSSDIVYVHSLLKVHSKSLYRDAASSASKRILRFLTKLDYTKISSFRLIRGEIARAVACTVDKKTFLDSALFELTSEQRRQVLHFQFQDNRLTDKSGYSFFKLIAHFGKMLLSADLSGFRLAFVSLLAFTFIAILIYFQYQFVVLADYIQTVAPGWLTLVGLLLINTSILILLALYLSKVFSLLIYRSNCPIPFLTVDRSKD